MKEQITNHKSYIFWLVVASLIFWLIFGIGLMRNYNNCHSEISGVSIFNINLFKFDNSCKSDANVYTLADATMNLRGFPFSERTYYYRFNQNDWRIIGSIITLTSFLNLIFYFGLFYFIKKIFLSLKNKYKRIFFLLIISFIFFGMLILSTFNILYGLNILTYVAILRIFF